MLIDATQLQAAIPAATNAIISTYLEPLNEQMQAAGIHTPLRVAHFLAQIGHESANLTSMEEGLNYGAAGLMATWPKLFDSARAADYAWHPERIANYAYASRNGNGDEKSGDGWRFRGRGAIQTTGRYNYLIYGKARGKDDFYTGNPDQLATDPDTAIDSACWYWISHGINKWADLDDILNVTKRVNGGTNGFTDRCNRLARAKEALRI